MKTKMTDYEKVGYGLMDEKDTWYWKKVEANREVVLSGKFGKVVHEETYSSYGDMMPLFVTIEYNGSYPSKVRMLQVNESGIFENCINVNL